jgi:hypothetical protein
MDQQGHFNGFGGGTTRKYVCNPVLRDEVDLTP